MDTNKVMRGRRPVCLAKTNIGSNDWWAELARKGTPIQYQIDKERVRVDFFWRDPEGAKSSVAKVLLEINSLVKADNWEPKSLVRIPNTDVWHGYLILHPQWRASYHFIPLPAESLPSIARFNGGDSKASQRRWYQSIMDSSCADPLSQYPTIANPMYKQASAFHGLAAGYVPGWEEWDNGELRAVTTQKFRWHSELLTNKRSIHCLETGEPSVKAKPVVMLLDGQYWRDRTGLPAVLEFLTRNKLLPPAVYILVDSIDESTRQAELACEETFWLAVFEELMPFLEQVYGLPKLAHNMLIAGHDMGGLAAMYAGLNWPSYVAKVLSLSGALGWPNIQREAIAKPNLESENLADQLMACRSQLLELSVYLNVGQAERSLIPHTEEMMYALRQRNSRVLYEVVKGGHDWLSWRSGLIRGLATLLST